MRLAEKIAVAISHMQDVSLYQGRDWFSPTEIGYEINGGHSSVGSPVLKEMVELGLAERNEKGHYKLISPLNHTNKHK